MTINHTMFGRFKSERENLRPFPKHPIRTLYVTDGQGATDRVGYAAVARKCDRDGSCVVELVDDRYPRNVIWREVWTREPDWSERP